MSEDGQEQGIGQRPMGRRTFVRLTGAAVALAALGRWLGGNSGGGSTTLAQEPTPTPEPTPIPATHEVFVPLVSAERPPAPAPEFEMLEFKKWEELRSWLETCDGEGVDLEHMTRPELVAIRNERRAGRKDPYRRTLLIIPKGILSNIQRLIDDAGCCSSELTPMRWWRAIYDHLGAQAVEAGFSGEHQLRLQTVIVLPDDQLLGDFVFRLPEEGEDPSVLKYPYRQRNIGEPDGELRLIPMPLKYDAQVVITKVHVDTEYPLRYDAIVDLPGYGKVPMISGPPHEWIVHYFVGDNIDGVTMGGPLPDYYFSSGKANIKGARDVDVEDNPGDIMGPSPNLQFGGGFFSPCSRLMIRAMIEHPSPGCLPYFAVQNCGLFYIFLDGSTRPVHRVYKGAFRFRFRGPDGEDLAEFVESNLHLFPNMYEPPVQELPVKRGNEFVLDGSVESEYVKPEGNLLYIGFQQGMFVIIDKKGGRTPFPLSRHFLNGLTLADAAWSPEEAVVDIVFNKKIGEIDMSSAPIKWTIHYVPNEKVAGLNNVVAHAQMGPDYQVVWVMELSAEADEILTSQHSHLKCTTSA